MLQRWDPQCRLAWELNIFKKRQSCWSSFSCAGTTICKAIQRKKFYLKPVQLSAAAQQATLQTVYQHNCGSDARTKQELCHLAGLLKLPSQERYNVNNSYLQGVFSWEQLNTTVPQGQDTSEGDWHSCPVSPQQSSGSWVGSVSKWACLLLTIYKLWLGRNGLPWDSCTRSFSPLFKPLDCNIRRHCIRASEQPQATAWHIKRNQKQSPFTLIHQTIIWDDSTCFYEQQRLEQLEASHSKMLLTHWAMLACFIFVFCPFSVLHIVGRGNNLLYAGSSGRTRQQQHIISPWVTGRLTEAFSPFHSF